jgi:hypothetical protein
MCDKDALQARHVAFKIKNNGIWQSKQQRFPIEFKPISPFVMEKSKDIEIKHFKILKDNYIQLYRQNKT